MILIAQWPRLCPQGQGMNSARLGERRLSSSAGQTDFVASSLLVSKWNLCLKLRLSLHNNTNNNVNLFFLGSSLWTPERQAAAVDVVVGARPGRGVIVPFDWLVGQWRRKLSCGGECHPCICHNDTTRATQTQHRTVYHYCIRVVTI